MTCPRCGNEDPQWIEPVPVMPWMYRLALPAPTTRCVLCGATWVERSDDGQEQERKG